MHFSALKTAHVTDLPGYNCLVGALSWAFLDTRKAASGPCDDRRCEQKPVVLVTPSGKLGKSKIFKRSAGSAAEKRGKGENVKNGNKTITFHVSKTEIHFENALFFTLQDCI